MEPPENRAGGLSMADAPGFYQMPGACVRVVRGGPTGSNFSVRFKTEMPTALVADVLGRLAIALAAGVDPRRAWASESARLPPRYRPALEAASRALAAGGGIADAMRAADGAFPAFVVGMAQVGDETGHQAETLRELAGTLRGMVRSSRALRASLVWPAFQLATALGVVGLLIFLAGVLTDGQGKGIDILGLGLAGVSGLTTYLALLGEATGNTAEVLDRIAGEFDDESRRGFEAAARGVGFAVWAAVGGLIGLVIFRIFSFYVGAIQDALR